MVATGRDILQADLGIQKTSFTLASTEISPLSATHHPRGLISVSSFSNGWAPSSAPFAAEPAVKVSAKLPGVEWRREWSRLGFWERESSRSESHMSQPLSVKDHQVEGTQHGHESTTSQNNTGRGVALSDRHQNDNRQAAQGQPVDNMPGENREVAHDESSRRSLGMRSILNPPQQEPSNNIRYPPPNSEPPIRPSSHVPSPPLRRPSPGPGRDSPASSIANRRILTPRSPGLRVANFGAPRGPENVPSLRSLDTQASSVRSEPSESPNPTITRAQYNFPPISESMSLGQPSQLQDSRPGSGPGHIPLSQYRNVETYRFGEGSQPPPFPPTLPSPFSGHGLPPQHHSNPHPDMPSEIGSRTRQMYLETAQGRIGIEVEVDTQAASRMADEKRRRNAGASARFRQRRKEKEREASQTISALENEIKTLGDERDFYIAERNYFRDLASRYTQVPPRPVSPRQRHSSLGEPSSSWQVSQNPDVQGRNTRRRTSLQPGSMSTLPSVPIGGPSSQTLPPPSQLPPGANPPYQPPAPYSPSRSGLSAGSPSTMPMPSRTISYDNSRPQESYDRSWNSGR